MSTKPASKSPKKATAPNKFHFEYLNPAQRMAWAAFEQHDVVFLSGPAGVGKSHLAMGYAIQEVLRKNRDRIILTRPIVESGESLGYLPGDFHEKVNPYMVPLYDCIRRIVGVNNPQREMIDASITVSPLAYMRGLTFTDAVCIFDEAQNATLSQLKLFLSRFGENSKIIITGDPLQTDLRPGESGFSDVMHRLETVPGIGIVKFKSDSIVRHPLVGRILERLEG